MSYSQPDLGVLPNTGATIASRFINTIVKMLPSQRRERGEREADKASAITQAFESVISQRDRDLIRERIML
jgi:hypothetical protein